MPKGHVQQKRLLTCSNPLCGQEFLYSEGEVHFKRTKKHFCSRSCQNTTHGLAGTPRHKIWERTKKRAKKSRLAFNLSLCDIPEIPEKCPILGILLQVNNVAGPLDSSPSIDRIQPTLGYVKGNIRIISNWANRLRGDSTAYELALLAEDSRKLELQEPFIVGRKPDGTEENQ